MALCSVEPFQISRRLNGPRKPSEKFSPSVPSRAFHTPSRPPSNIRAESRPIFRVETTTEDVAKVGSHTHIAIIMNKPRTIKQKLKLLLTYESTACTVSQAKMGINIRFTIP